MPIFGYSAVDATGGRIKDFIDATDQVSAVNRLHQRGLTVIEINQKEHGFDFGHHALIARLGWVRTADVVLFFRMFAALINLKFLPQFFL